MIAAEMKENIKRHYGDSDEDLKDLGEIMDALSDLENVENLKRNMETMRVENDKALKDLDDSWRKRYRERFFDGDVQLPDFDFEEDEKEEDNPEDISIDDFLEEFTKKE